MFFVFFTVTGAPLTLAKCGLGGDLNEIPWPAGGPSDSDDT